MDSLKGEDKPEQTQQTTTPWEPAIPALRGALGESANLYQNGLNFLQNRQGQGNPLYDQSTQALGNMFSGSGPLQALTDTAQGNHLDITKSPLWGTMTGGIQDAVNSQFSAVGRTGSPAHAGVMTSELGKLAAQLYGTERQNQLGAANSLGGFAQSAAGMAPGVYQFGNAPLDDLWKNLARFQTMAGQIGGMGGTQIGTAPDNGPSALQQGIGTALSLAAMFA